MKNMKNMPEVRAPSSVWQVATKLQEAEEVIEEYDGKEVEYTHIVYDLKSGRVFETESVENLNLEECRILISVHKDNKDDLSELVGFMLNPTHEYVIKDKDGNVVDDEL